MLIDTRSKQFQHGIMTGLDNALSMQQLVRSHGPGDYSRSDAMFVIMLNSAIMSYNGTSHTNPHDYVWAMGYLRGMALASQYVRDQNRLLVHLRRDSND